MNEHLAVLVRGGEVDEAVALAADLPTGHVADQVPRADRGSSWSLFLDRWLSSLPPLERLQAAVDLGDGSLMLECQEAAADAFVEHLRGFESFIDSPDAEVSATMMTRFEPYAERVESMSFDPRTARRVRPRPTAPATSGWPFEDDHPPREAPLVLPADQNELMTLIAAGRQVEALRLALDHRAAWVEIRLDYDAVDLHDEPSSTFIRAWLPQLPALERLQASGWAASNYQLALVHLPHSYGIGARLTLDALSTAATGWAGLLRALGSSVAAGEEADLTFGRRLEGHAEELEAMSFESIPAEPWV